MSDDITDKIYEDQKEIIEKALLSAMDKKLVHCLPIKINPEYNANEFQLPIGDFTEERKTQQQPHQKLTDEQLEQTFMDIQCSLFRINSRINSISEEYKDLECFYDKIKRHFYPHKFIIHKMTLGELSGLFEESYGE